MIQYKALTFYKHQSNTYNHQHHYPKYTYQASRVQVGFTSKPLSPSGALTFRK